MEVPAATSPPADRDVKFHEGWLEHKGHDGKWTKYWCVLKNNVFFFFSSDINTASQIGTLTLDHKSKVEYRGGDPKSGFKFDLYTPKRLSYCKTQKSCERELWKAYVDGITKGRIADTIDLLPGQIREIQDQLGRYFQVKVATISPGLAGPTAGAARRDSDPGSWNSFDSPDSTASGSFVMYCPQDYLTPVPPQPGVLQQQDSSNPGPLAYQAETSRLVFYSDMTRAGWPSWYFHNCTRQQAEEILSIGAHFGNTLMRSRPDDELDLVISKMNGPVGATSYSHFIVKCHPNGYKIDVENPHEPMGSLAEVMKFFVETSGRTATKPMTCNDLGRLGLAPENNPYSTSIIAVKNFKEKDEEKKMRYPHTTKEVSSRRNPHPSVKHVRFSHPGQGPLDDPYFFPPPPPPLSASDTETIPAEFPPPVPHEAAGHPLPPVAHKHMSHQINQGPGHKGLFDRSKSEPNIPNDILAHVQRFREQQLKKANGVSHGRKGLMNKSQSLDSERDPPPLPPNHPTAGKSELQRVTQAIAQNRKMSEPTITEDSLLTLSHSGQQPLNSATVSGTERSKDTLTPPTNTRQRDPTQQDSSAIASTVPKIPVAESADVNSKKTGFPQPEADNALSELAAVTARVAKQQLVVKKAPEVAPKPSPAGAATVSNAVTDGQESLQPAQIKAPLTNLATDSFKKKLGNLMVGNTATSTAPQTGHSPVTSQRNSAAIAPGLYEDIEHYQNAKEILAGSRNH